MRTISIFILLSILSNSSFSQIGLGSVKKLGKKEEATKSESTNSNEKGEKGKLIDENYFYSSAKSFQYATIEITSIGNIVKFKDAIGGLDSREFISNLNSGKDNFKKYSQTGQSYITEAEERYSTFITYFEQTALPGVLKKCNEAKFQKTEYQNDLKWATECKNILTIGSAYLKDNSKSEEALKSLNNYIDKYAQYLVAEKIISCLESLNSKSHLIFNNSEVCECNSNSNSISSDANAKTGIYVQLMDQDAVRKTVLSFDIYVNEKLVFEHNAISIVSDKFLVKNDRVVFQLLPGEDLQTPWAMDFLKKLHSNLKSGDKVKLVNFETGLAGEFVFDHKSLSMEDTYNALFEKMLKGKLIPAAVIKDAALENDFKAAFEKKYGIKPNVVSLQSSEWFIKKDSRGVILHRSKTGYIGFKEKDSNCYYREVTVYQDRKADGNYDASYIGSVGGTYQIHESNLK